MSSSGASSYPLNKEEQRSSRTEEYLFPLPGILLNSEFTLASVPRLFVSEVNNDSDSDKRRSIYYYCIIHHDTAWRVWVSLIIIRREAKFNEHDREKGQSAILCFDVTGNFWLQQEVWRRAGGISIECQLAMGGNPVKVFLSSIQD